MKSACTNKGKYKLQRMLHGEQAGGERNLITAINRGGYRAHDLRTTPEGDFVNTIDYSLLPSTTRP